MNHKFSTYALIFCILLVGIVYLISALSSEDIDTLCNQDNSTLYRFGGEWICGNLTTNVYNTTIYQNVSEIDPIYESEKDIYFQNPAIEDLDMAYFNIDNIFKLFVYDGISVYNPLLDEYVEVIDDYGNVNATNISAINISVFNILGYYNGTGNPPNYPAKGYPINIIGSIGQSGGIVGGSGGDINLIGGQGGQGGSANGGNILIQGGNEYASGQGGNITIQAGGNNLLGKIILNGNAIFNDSLCNSTGSCFTLSELNMSLNDGAQYQFTDNNFNGSGNFTTTDTIFSKNIKTTGSVAFNNNSIDSKTGINNFVYYTTATTGILAGLRNWVYYYAKGGSTNPTIYSINFGATWIPAIGTTASRTMGNLWGGTATTELTLDANESFNYTITNMYGFRSQINIAGSSTNSTKIGYAKVTTANNFRAESVNMGANSSMVDLYAFYDEGQDNSKVTNAWGYYGLSSKNYMSGNLSVGALNSTNNINTQTNFSVNNVNGITGNFTILKDADLILLTKTYCSMNFSGGILISSNC